jgi:hypothetical protein
VSPQLSKNVRVAEKAGRKSADSNVMVDDLMTYDSFMGEHVPVVGRCPSRNSEPFFPGIHMELL